jgi:hypothetical protein
MEHAHFRHYGEAVQSYAFFFAVEIDQEVAIAAFVRNTSLLERCAANGFLGQLDSQDCRMGHAYRNIWFARFRQPVRTAMRRPCYDQVLALPCIAAVLSRN